jgi:hypothetical protein
VVDVVVAEEEEVVVEEIVVVVFWSRFLLLPCGIGRNLEIGKSASKPAVSQ